MNTVSFSSKEKINQQASLWIAKLDSGLSKSQQQELNQWLALSKAHSDALIDYAELWDVLDVLAPIAGLIPLDEQSASLGSVENASLEAAQKTKSKLFEFAVAASFALFCVALALLVNEHQESPIGLKSVATAQHSSQHESQQYMTQIGEHSNVVLTDGSKLKLNTNTLITVTYTDNIRNIELHKGEVFCEVTKNPQRPFVVVAGDNTVAAIGTAFNMQIDLTHELEVLVTEGKVKIDARRGAFDLLPDLSTDSTYLTVGEKALISDKKLSVTTVDDLEDILAWHQEMLVFTGEPLEKVIKEISRYTPLKLKVVDPEIRQIPVGGYFKVGDMELLLTILKQNFGVDSVRLDNQILLMKAL